MVPGVVQEITDIAGVGFGSFCNHFDDKAAPWEAVMAGMLRAHGDITPIGDE
jgi:hypothetical protein